MNEEQPLASVWNFDGAQYYAIYQLKNNFLMNMMKKDLEQAYWTVRTLRMELDAKLQDKFKKKEQSSDDEPITNDKEKKLTEKEVVDGMLAELSDIRELYNSSTKPTNYEQSVYFTVLETFYMQICKLMKKHGFYFRENEDMSKAVFRR